MRREKSSQKSPRRNIWDLCKHETERNPSKEDEEKHIFISGTPQCGSVCAT